MSRTWIRRPSVAALVVAVVAALAACGGEATAGNGVDRAFAEQMTPHHESAVEMADIALRRAEREELRALARDIKATQTQEIATLESAGEALQADGVKAGDLGVADHAMGMDGDAAALESADPFDRAFVEMMIPHHEGAIRMARAELSRGKHPELKRLAKDIVDAQAREIETMRAMLRRPASAG